MEELGVCVSFQQPLLSTSLPPVFFLSSEDLHHLIFKVVPERPTILVQATSISSRIQLLDFGKKVGLGYSSMLAKIRPPTLKQLPNIIGLGMPPINGTTTPGDSLSMIKPSVNHQFPEAWNLKPARLKEKSRMLPGQHNSRIQHQRSVI
jgi:hypothetical protein